MPNFAPSVWPVPDRYIDLGKETAPGTIAAATYTFPMTQFKPVDKRTRLEDTAWRNTPAHLFNLIDGVRVADLTAGGPLFADGIGYALLSVTGDYYQFVNGVVGTFTSLSGSTAIGAGTVVVVSATGISVGNIISVGATATTAEEVRKVTNISGGTLTLNAPLYQGHASAGTVFAYSSVTTFGHVFTLLNPQSGYNGAGGSTSAQPPTYTYYDWTGISGTSGARQYGFARYTEVSITGHAENLLEWDGKITALASTIAASAPPVSITLVPPQPAWNTTVTLGGAGTLNDMEWKLTLARKAAAMFGNNGQQDFYALPAGYFDASIAWKFGPASDESEFLYYVNNTQPTLVIAASNGLSGTSAASVTITANALGFTEGALDDGADVFGYDMTTKLIANTVNIGPSGGYSPLTVQLINGQINY